MLIEQIPRYRPVQENIVVQQTNGVLQEYQIPDESFVPEVWVYFDFLRPATAITNLIQLGDNKTITVEQIAESDTLVTAQAQSKVDFYYDIFDNYFRTFGTTGALTLFGDRTQITGDKRNAKQHFINLVLQHFLADVSIQRTSAGPSSFSLNFSAPIMDRRRSYAGVDPQFNFDDLLFWNHFFTQATDNFTILDQLISPHTWTYIWARGRFDPANYYPIFTGFTTRVTDSEQGGYQGIEVGGLDMIKLLQKGTLRVNPAIGDPAAITAITGENFSMFAQPMAGASLEKIYRTLILGEEFTGAAGPLVSGGLGVLNYEELGSPGPGQPPASELVAEGIKTVLDAKVIPVPQFADAANIPQMIRDKHISAPFFPPKLMMWGTEIDAYRQMLPMTSPSFFSSAYQNRFEAVMEAARRTMTEFYADEMGFYVSHPFRHALAFLTSYAVAAGSFIADPGFPSVYVLSKEELIGGNYTLSDDELITALIFAGQTPNVGSSTTLFDFVGGNRDIVFADELLLRYGCWFLEHQEPLVNNGVSNTNQKGENAANLASQIKLFAYARLIYNNKDVYSGQATTVFRPEAQPARPVWFPERRDVGYVVTLDHNIPMGGFATTGWSVSFMRKVDSLPIDLTEFLVQSNTFAPITPGDLPILLELFRSAANLVRTPTLASRLMSPGSILASSTLMQMVQSRVNATGKDTVTILNEIIQQGLINTSSILNTSR